jgi:hypothetical protein
MSREIALEALWIKQGVRRILRVAASIACWPIRTSGLLVLRLIERDVRHTSGLRSRFGEGLAI